MSSNTGASMTVKEKTNELYQRWSNPALKRDCNLPPKSVAPFNLDIRPQTNLLVQSL